jgi:hypothetical protein
MRAFAISVFIFLLVGIKFPAAHSGVITIIWNDTPFQASAEFPVVFLTDRNGDIVKLLLDDAMVQHYGGLVQLNRREVTAFGNWAGPFGLVRSEFRADSLQFEAMPNPAVLGSQPWANILCKYADNVAEPKSVAYFQGLLGLSKPGLSIIGVRHPMRISI